MTTAPLAAARSPRPIGRRSAWLAVLCAQFGLSLGSTIVKEIGAPGLATAAWRLVFGSAIWMVVLHGGVAGSRRGPPVWPGPSAVFFAADIALFFVAVTKTSVANAEFIGSLVPVAVVPLAALLFHERVRGVVARLRGGLALAGVAVILFTAPASGISTPAGNAPRLHRHGHVGRLPAVRPREPAPCSAPRSS